MKINEDGTTVMMRIPDNWHVHFRQGPFLKFLTKLFIDNGWRGRLVAEPNTNPPILTGKQAQDYSFEISRAAGPYVVGSFNPVVAIQITESTTPLMVHDAFSYGVKVCKVYPRYVTTNSEHGV